jgi:hypothetical protein
MAAGERRHKFTDFVCTFATTVRIAGFQLALAALEHGMVGGAETVQMTKGCRRLARQACAHVIHGRYMIVGAGYVAT